MKSEIREALTSGSNWNVPQVLYLQSKDQHCLTFACFVGFCCAQTKKPEFGILRLPRNEPIIES